MNIPSEHLEMMQAAVPEGGELFPVVEIRNLDGALSKAQKRALERALEGPLTPDDLAARVILPVTVHVLLDSGMLVPYRSRDGRFGLIAHPLAAVAVRTRSKPAWFSGRASARGDGFDMVIGVDQARTDQALEAFSSPSSRWGGYKPTKLEIARYFDVAVIEICPASVARERGLVSKGPDKLVPDICADAPITDFQYRLVRHKDGRLAIHDVSHDDDGRPDLVIQTPVYVVGDNRRAVRRVLKQMAQALTLPILDAARFDLEG